ncbi:MAG: hypothetical protein AMXMBFR56_49420 [Polyangiaceae bacterium]
MLTPVPGREISQDVFQPILTEAELPAVGTPEGATLDFKAKLDPNWTNFWLARQVAAFANSVGGTLLIGAGEDGRDALKQYLPLTQADAEQVERSYGNAVRDRCSPQPYFEPVRIPKDTGFVVAINVWPFPGQAIGVRGSLDRAIDRSGSDAYVFPLRSGRNTTEILPEQLPMLMLPELRRVAVLLAGIRPGEPISVSHCSYYQNVIEMRLTEVEFLANTVTLEFVGSPGGAKLSLPLDQVETVWRVSGKWRVHLRGQIEGEANHPSYLFTPDLRRFKGQ